MEAATALNRGDQLLKELMGEKREASSAPTMGRLQKTSYTHEAMIELIIQQPTMSQDALAAHFGYTPGWISNVLASDAFQERLAKRKEEVVDPVLKASIEERFKALVHQSLTVLMEKLSKPTVSDNVAIRAAELGAKALGVGGHAAPRPASADSDHLAKLADRLLLLQSNVRERVVNGEVQVLKVEREGPEAGRELQLSGPQSSLGQPA